MQENDYHYVRYSFSGDLYTQKDNWGLANSVYAIKTLYITDALKNLKESDKEHLYQTVISFTKDQGYIYDPLISKPSFKSFLKSFISSSRRHSYKTHTENTRRGETKQAFAVLQNLGKKPLQPFTPIPKTSEEITTYLGEYNWSTPWHSCAHFAILMFFLKYNDLFFDKNNNDELIRSAVAFMDNMQSSDDGCWYQGRDVPLYEKVNGAMKYLTGIHAADIYEFNYPEKLVDTALTATNDEHACNNFNVTYCLYAAQKIIPDYRKDEVEAFLLSRLDIYKEFYFPKYGGFSFNKGRANSLLYGAKISKGVAEPDIHGTSLFMFGIALIDEVLSLNLNLKIPVT
jgi:hypothetical protein